MVGDGLTQARSMTETPLKTDIAHALHRLGFVGFGEAGMAFVSGWRREKLDLGIRGFDLKTTVDDGSVAEAKWQDYTDHGVEGGASIGEALGDALVVFSMVTADQAHIAAKSAAQVMTPGAFFLDCNSCAPETKRASARVVEAAGVRYVDTAVMAPVHPKLHETPLLISGPHTQEAAPVMEALGLKMRIVPGDVGRASAIKMMRSVIIKGIEALVLEGLLSARKAGVDDEVIASLDASFPGWDWTKRASYSLERVTTHGLRRAAEMREVAKTVADLGLMNGMSDSIADWQQAVGDLDLPSGNDDFGTRADAILAAMEKKA